MLEVNIKYTLNTVKYEVLDSAKGPKDCKKLQFNFSSILPVADCLAAVDSVQSANVLRVKPI